MQSAQLLKGILEGCVLLVIGDKEVYGYDLVQQLRDLGFIKVTGGTVYPLLQKLEKHQL
ncbi:PadR family transcriptional regulator, partial [Lactobacillus sp. XV13L]|nr:PadR family transcriptional regulator [Lactobacillus sp. XV13L]